jgi:hypothetical protein
VVLHFEKIIYLVHDDLKSLLLIVIFFLDFEGSNQVHDLILVFDRVDPPVLYDEGQLRHFFLGFFGVLIVVKNVSHDSDQHVKKHNTHDEGHKQKEEKTDNCHFIVEVLFSAQLA